MDPLTDVPRPHGGGSRVLVVVAHPDDEAFGCGSLLLHAHDGGSEVRLLCATRGEAGEVTAEVAVPAEGLGALRERELRRSAEILGVAQVEVLDLLDSGMEGEPPPGSLAAAAPAEVTAAVEKAVASFSPDVLLTLDGGDGHRDHVVVRDATIAVGRARDLPVLLHCLPRSVMRQWAEHRMSVDPDSAYLRGVELGTPDEQVTDVLDTSRLLERRWEAIRAHASQTSPFEGLPEELQRAFLTRDHLIRV